jgi:hypothetical protein
MFKSNKVAYRIKGRERNQLEDMLRQLVAMQNGFFGLAQFIAQREGLDLSKVQFDQNDMSFNYIPEPEQRK